MRCNVGVNPLYLADQHLIAEYRELPMVIGSLEYWKWQIKSDSLPTFNLGTGHLNFFKNKLLYLRRRHDKVIEEMRLRGFRCDLLRIRVEECPEHLRGDWNPTIEDSLKIRQRIYERLTSDKHKYSWWRYERFALTEDRFKYLVDRIMNGELYPV